MLSTLLVTLTLAVIWKGKAAAECPCMYLEADPLFPGTTGYRWDCEYVVHGLTEVPSACWAEHPHATQVFLDYNNIEAVPRAGFVGLDDLRTLSLKHNAITAIDEEALTGLSSLEFLDLSANKLKSPPSQVWQLTGLTHLYLGDNSFTDAETFTISNLVNLEVLDLHLNHLREIPHDSLQPLTKLRKVHLYWNMLVNLPNLTENVMMEELLVNGNALLKFPKYMFGNLTSPLTYHFVDNPAYDVWATMLLPLPDRSHIVMGFDVSVWAEDEQQAQELIQKDWLVQDGLSQTLDLASLVKICGRTSKQQQTRLPPC
ncbi:Leucine-rich repeat-containing G-protein coupled receptor 4 [Chionoecetes opilio]|uniref:Leucine-rich repeat-containing G-protein coupled receptor 4 n=1 Tax=Chionoecetes opilio TaxID=41210 RepID=A0A8J5CT09_CHIOP|nr:Leucine-rich repeat-containing G-protein coupled receptor 4 [Chionoecetes opilio]